MKDTPTSHLETLAEIRQLMERSSRFISLSGLSGVFAGCYALVGVYIAHYYYMGKELVMEETLQSPHFLFFFMDAAIVLLLAVGTGIFLTTRKAKKDGRSIFDATAQKLLINLCIPLFIGGVFCLALIYHRTFGYLAPAMLLFYGLSLVNASKYSRDDIRYLGFLEIALGLLSSFFIGYGFLFWSIGFGVLHIVYGTYMYVKYER